MRHPVRLLCCAAMAAFTLNAAPAMGAEYPSKPVKLLVGMAPGGANDTIARLISAELTDTMGQSFLVENKPGANSIIATNEVARATPDGHTLLLVISSHVTNTMLYPDLAYKLADFDAVSVVAETPFVLVSTPSFAPNTVEDVIAMARGGKVLDFGTPGLGSTQHIALELMTQMADIEMNHIPYKGGAPAQTDVMGGQIPLIFATPAQSLPFIQQGKLKPLGVTSSTRLPQLEQTPTLAESGIPDYAANVWFGVVAPAGTPVEIRERLASEIARIVSKDDVQAKLAGLGLSPIAGTPDEFQALLASEQTKWAEVIGNSNIKIQ